MSRKKLHHPDTTGKGLGNAGQQTELPGAGQYIGAGTNIRVNTGLQKGKEFWNPLRFIQNSAVRITNCQFNLQFVITFPDWPDQRPFSFRDDTFYPFHISLCTLLPVIGISGHENYSDYVGFWGGVLNPPKEADINRLCSQFSLY